MVRVIVQIDMGTTREEEEAIRAALAAVDMRDYRIFRQNPGVGGMLPVEAWTLIIMVPLSVFLKSFLTKFGETLGAKAGEDAYPHLKNGAYATLRTTLEGLRAIRNRARGITNGYFQLVDTVTGMSVVITQDLTDEAYASLADLDRSALNGNFIQYNPQSRQWEVH